jgi:hypothetical protein
VPRLNLRLGYALQCRQGLRPQPRPRGEDRLMQPLTVCRAADLAGAHCSHLAARSKRAAASLTVVP